MIPALLPLLALTAGGGLVYSYEGELVAFDSAAWDRAGEAVAVDAGVAVVGARWQDSTGPDAGAAYVYARSGFSWSSTIKLVGNDTVAADLFGSSVAVNGDTIVVGAPTADLNGANEGAAYVFFFNGSSWIQQAKLVASDRTDQDRFGSAVAIDGDCLVVGAMGDDDLGSYSGSAYVFLRSGTSWAEQSKLRASDGRYNTYFGSSVDIDGSSLVVGAPGSSGGAYVFIDLGGAWAEQAKLIDPSVFALDRFGESVAIDGDTVAVGSPFDDNNGTDSGSVLIFDRVGTTWGYGAIVLAGEQYGELGASVGLHGGALVAGAPADWQLGLDSLGAVYLFLDRGTFWSQEDVIAPTGLGHLDEFGAAIAFDGESLISGVPGSDVTAANAGGARAYQIVPGITPYCYGDGSGVTCPCSNDGPSGRGCMNSSATGGRLDGEGPPTLSPDVLTFAGAGLVTGQSALLFVGQNAVNGGLGNLFGDGLRCAGGGTIRLGVKVPSAMGAAQWGPGLAVKGMWSAGDVRRFQCWYRDPAGGPCGTGFNLTNGVEVTFVP